MVKVTQQWQDRLVGAVVFLVVFGLALGTVWARGAYVGAKAAHEQTAQVSRFLNAETIVTLTAPDGSKRQATVLEILGTLVQERIQAIQQESAKEQAAKTTPPPAAVPK